MATKKTKKKELVIVESPAKAKTIQKFLGDNFIVKSSFGHIRDLPKNDTGVDIKNNFTPTYVIDPDKKKIIDELKKESKEAHTVWLASDEDREGEAIAWHLSEALSLPKEKRKRIVFHEITKKAIEEAVKNPRDIDINLVNAQQARRILDRLVGYELSPILWKKIKANLSAGRVQSVAVRLIVEREREIQNFQSKTFFKVTGTFMADGQTFKAELDKKFDTEKEVQNFLETCKNAVFTIESIETKPARRSPSAPFTTSTLQQEASRKLGFSVAQTMTLAQRLYEAGHITYMRTDSVNLSELALETSEEVIKDFYGKQYHQKRQFTNKSKNAQEAHEAIRPTYINKLQIEGEKNEQRLYELIWKRTVASQMADAILEKTIAKINISNREEKFVAQGEVIRFDGFLKLYIESTDDENENEENKTALLPPLKKGQKTEAKQITALQRFTHHPPRYTEASLVKKLEELGIGRPSTYAPTISTIQKRDYVIKTDKEGTPRPYVQLTLEKNTIHKETKTENTGTEKAKLFPTDLGMVVTDFLMKHFPEIMDYQFTAHVEEEFDEIAIGKLDWRKMLGKFYFPFHKDVVKTIEESERTTGERILGTDPKTGKKVIARIGRFGPLVQIGEQGDEEKPVYAKMPKNLSIHTITLEQALELFKLPKVLGQHHGKEVIVNIGRFGPYVMYDGTFASIPKEEDPHTITLERAIELITSKQEAAQSKIIQSFEEEGIQILNGRYGPYISYNKKNYKVPKEKDPKTLTLSEVISIIGDDYKPAEMAEATAKETKTTKTKKAASSVNKKISAKKK
ncbi:MAG: type I DNA topoisomerase [Bacteroidia bacterium]|nr:type I DNA topoisomerase [Bacteroidia bacterium]